MAVIKKDLWLNSKNQNRQPEEFKTEFLKLVNLKLKHEGTQKTNAGLKKALTIHCITL